MRHANVGHVIKEDILKIHRRSPITYKAKTFKVELKLANHSDALLPSRQVWLICTRQFMFLNSSMRQIKVETLPLILHLGITST